MTEAKKRGRGRPPSVTPEILKDIKTRYEAGQSLDHLSFATGITRATAKRHLLAMGVEWRKPKRKAW